MDYFLKEIRQCRNALKKNRKKFWNNNKENFEKNIQKIIKTQKLPSGWKIYFVVSSFLSNKKILPFDYDSWSVTDLIAATKKQGFEIMVFFNRDRAEFLSVPALAPLVIHELKHVKQAAKFSKKFVKATIDDKVARDIEIDAEKDIKNISDEFRKEKILESILYCYDLGKWKTAQKMANFFYKDREEIYSGGYNKEMTKEEYEIFLKARKNKDINIFIDFFKIV
jgi:hypothetical protein